MDLLQRELARKKKLLQKGARFVKAADLRKRREREQEERIIAQQECLKQDQKEGPQVPLGAKRKTDNGEKSNDDSSRAVSTESLSLSSKKAKLDTLEQENTKNNNSNNNNNNNNNNTKEQPSSMYQMSAEEITAKFRSMGLPIRLFGEQAWARLKRLQVALEEQKQVLAGLSEKDEFRLGSGHRIRNPFLEKDDTEATSSATDAAALADSHHHPSVKTTSLDDNNNKNNSNSNNNNKNKKKDDDKTEDASEDDHHKFVYKYFKGLLDEWEADMARRPDAVKRSVAGRNETKTMMQCKDYIGPLFKLCKKRTIEPGLLAHIHKIVTFCQQGEFVKAHDAYLDVAIGRAAWPIGVTMVGIHARTGRAKIESANVAHVMNSELQRKYLTSVKRLMTYAQKKRDDVDPSKKVMN